LLVAKRRQALGKVRDPDMQSKLFKLGLEPPIAISPACRPHLDVSNGFRAAQRNLIGKLTRARHQLLAGQHFIDEASGAQRIGIFKPSRVEQLRGMGWVYALA
jgi:hypothetical protein